MDIFQVFRDRRSIRRYRDTPVEQEKIEHILEAARLAPSWKNLQCWHFIVINEEARRHELLDAFHPDNPGTKAVASAPVIIVVCADPKLSGVENGIEYYIADTAMAFEHLCLAAHALGMGTCWMGWFDEQKIKDSLQIPAGIKVVGVTPLGYPDQQPNQRPRKELSDIVSLNQWESTDA